MYQPDPTAHTGDGIAKRGEEQQWTLKIYNLCVGKAGRILRTVGTNAASDVICLNIQSIL